MLEAAIYHLLKKHFRPEPYYVDLLELFLEVSAGWCHRGLSSCDTLSALSDSPDTGCPSLSERQSALGPLRPRGIGSTGHIAHTPQTTFQTELGQLIDLITAPEDHVDLSKFSLEK